MHQIELYMNWIDKKKLKKKGKQKKSEIGPRFIGNLENPTPLTVSRWKPRKPDTIDDVIHINHEDGLQPPPWTFRSRRWRLEVVPHRKLDRDSLEIF